MNVNTVAVKSAMNEAKRARLAANRAKAAADKAKEAAETAEALAKEVEKEAKKAETLAEAAKTGTEAKAAETAADGAKAAAEKAETLAKAAVEGSKAAETETGTEAKAAETAADGAKAAAVKTMADGRPSPPTIVLLTSPFILLVIATSIIGIVFSTTLYKLAEMNFKDISCIPFFTAVELALIVGFTSLTIFALYKYIETRQLWTKEGDDLLKDTSIFNDLAIRHKHLSQLWFAISMAILCGGLIYAVFHVMKVPCGDVWGFYPKKNGGGSTLSQVFTGSLGIAGV